MTPETVSALVGNMPDPSGVRPRPEPSEGDASVPGPLLFARYAYPPNSLGYCGPRDSASLLGYGSERLVDGGLRQLARGFEGAYPYLELIARATGIPDPLDRRVVEAYWLGNELLDRVDFRLFGSSLLDRFRHRAGLGWSQLAEAIPVGAVPNHAFHVFGVYPWVGMLRGERAEPLQVLEQCRIRWGEVVTASGDQVAVLSRPLVFDGLRLSLGEPRLEAATLAVDGAGLAGDLRPGDHVSLHWHWVCDRLSRRQLANLRRQTMRQLHITNDLVSHPGPAVAMS